LGFPHIALLERDSSPSKVERDSLEREATAHSKGPLRTQEFIGKYLKKKNGER